MTEDFLSRAMREYERVRPRETMKPSLEARMELLEAAASAQRTAILRLEKITRLLFKSVCGLAVVSMMLALLVLT